MTKILFILLLLSSSMLHAKLKVAVAYPYIKEITKKIASNKVDITLLARGDWDPHFIVPKPSLVSHLRDSDLLILNGASLEIGWLYPLLKSANNNKIRAGAKGHLDLSEYIKLKDVPKRVTRAMGHVHAEGNPHYILDPHNVIKLSKVIYLKLSQLDSANRSFYKSNFMKFRKHWKSKLRVYDRKMKKCRGMKVVEYHELFNYFLYRYGIESVDNIEPLAGVSPNPKHTIKLIGKMKKERVKLILQDVYHEHKTAKFIAKKTGARLVKLPHDVGAIRGVNSLDKFYDTLVSRVCR